VPDFVRDRGCSFSFMCQNQSILFPLVLCPYEQVLSMRMPVNGTGLVCGWEVQSSAYGLVSSIKSCLVEMGTPGRCV